MGPIGNGKEARGTRKHIEQEISAQTKSVHVDFVFINHASQFIDLGDAGELDLVDHEDLDALAHRAIDVRPECL